LRKILHLSIKGKYSRKGKFNGKSTKIIPDGLNKRINHPG